MTSMYVGGRAVRSFENCSTNVLIKVMGVKALFSATLAFKKILQNWLSSMINNVCYGIWIQSDDDCNLGLPSHSKDQATLVVM